MQYLTGLQADVGAIPLLLCATAEDLPGQLNAMYLAAWNMLQALHHVWLLAAAAERMCIACVVSSSYPSVPACCKLMTHMLLGCLHVHIVSVHCTAPSLS